jgi:hypothetical protein
MGRLFDGCLARLFWILTPPAWFIADWWEQRRRKKKVVN